ncbi:hypothetical protein Bca101_027170 [Brassica carinata]
MKLFFRERHIQVGLSIQVFQVGSSRFERSGVRSGRGKLLGAWVFLLHITSPCERLKDLHFDGVTGVQKANVCWLVWLQDLRVAELLTIV